MGEREREGEEKKGGEDEKEGGEKEGEEGGERRGISQRCHRKPAGATNLP